jgi:hypothetical protein
MAGYNPLPVFSLSVYIAIRVNYPLLRTKTMGQKWLAYSQNKINKNEAVPHKKSPGH